MAPIPRAALVPLRSFREAIVAPEVPVRESPSVSFGDLVRMLAEGIADAQTSLDRASADLVEELAGTTVNVIPQVIETIDADGKITFEQAEPQAVSPQPGRDADLLPVQPGHGGGRDGHQGRRERTGA